MVDLCLLRYWEGAVKIAEVLSNPGYGTRITRSFKVRTSGAGINRREGFADLMTMVIQRVHVAFLLITQLVFGFGSIHGHDLWAHSGSGETSPRVTSHTCGAREIHVPLEELARCPICMTGTSRSATMAATYPAPALSAVAWFTPGLLVPVLAPVDIHSSGKRGPPLF